MRRQCQVYRFEKEGFVGGETLFAEGRFEDAERLAKLIAAKGGQCQQGVLPGHKLRWSMDDWFEVLQLAGGVKKRAQGSVGNQYSTGIIRPVDLFGVHEEHYF